MNRFEWNGLTSGDRVLVHGVTSDIDGLANGVVARVEDLRKNHGVGISTGVDGITSIHWYSRFEVHLDPRDSADGCWRCLAAAHVAAS